MENPSDAIKNFYAGFDGDFESVNRRFSSEAKVLKYLSIFLKGKDDESLIEAAQACNFEDVFRITHNIKGVAANLGFSKLFNESSILCEMCRNGNPGCSIEDNVRKINEEYRVVTQAVKELLSSVE